MTRVLEGTTVAKSVEEVLKVDIAKLETMHRRIPQLVVIMVGDNPASLSYVGGKEKACARVGIKSQVLHFERTIPQKRFDQDHRKTQRRSESRRNTDPVAITDTA